MLDRMYIVAGEAARCLYEKRGLDCDIIEFVLPRRVVTPEVVSMIRDWADPNVNEMGFRWESEGVPMTFKFVGDHDHFTYADERVYGPEVYRIPNQWNDYWERREELV